MAIHDVAETTRFDGFTLDRRRRLLLAGGKPVSLHARALSLLTFLIDNRERPVPRAEILAHVWEGRAVADNNLAVQLSALRKALTDAGATDTPMIAEHWKNDAHRRRVESMSVLNRTAEAREIAAGIAFLVSPQASAVTGSTLVADNGLMMY